MRFRGSVLGFRGYGLAVQDVDECFHEMASIRGLADRDLHGFAAIHWDSVIERGENNRQRQDVATCLWMQKTKGHIEVC